MAWALAGIFLAAAAISQIDCSSGVRSSNFKAVVLGFDGVDPDFVQAWIDELPNIRALSESGTLTALGSTNPPQSPVAWASFATGTNPGKHGIFDFVRRDPESYLPEISPARFEKRRFLFDSIPVRGPDVVSNRAGVPFWKRLDEAGFETVNLRMPFELPVTPLKHGRTLAGLGVPDAAGTWGTYHYLATDLSVWDLRENAVTESGGRQVLLELEDEETNSNFFASIKGPSDARRNVESDPLEIALEVQRNEEATAVTIKLQDQQQTVDEGNWSDWFEFEFDLGPFASVRGLGRFYVLETFPEVRLYLPPISPDPDDPPLPISHPPGYSAGFRSRLGPFKTHGWIHETWGLNDEQIDEAVFLEDVFRNMDSLEKMLLQELDQRGASLYSAVFTGTDSVSHLFYRLMDPDHPRYETDLAERFGDAVLRVYKKMDSIIGSVVERLEPQDLLLVVSGYGFHTFRKEFNTNTWLVENGYMTLKAQPKNPTPNKFGLMFNGGSLFPKVDWARTRAYALGLGHIYINLKWREGQGIVRESERDRLVREIRDRIVEYRDPDTGEPVLVSAYDTAEIYSGKNREYSGDIQLGFQSGYRTSWQTALGAVPRNVIVANLKKWSGDHNASDVSETAGILLSNRKIDSANPDILDVAPTLLQAFGLAVPDDLDGKSLSYSANPSSRRD